MLSLFTKFFPSERILGFFLRSPALSVLHASQDYIATMGHMQYDEVRHPLLGQRHGGEKSGARSPLPDSRVLHPGIRFLKTFRQSQRNLLQLFPHFWRFLSRPEQTCSLFIFSIWQDTLAYKFALIYGMSFPQGTTRKNFCVQTIACYKRYQLTRTIMSFFDHDIANRVCWLLTIYFVSYIVWGSPCYVLLSPKGNIFLVSRRNHQTSQNYANSGLVEVNSTSKLIGSHFSLANQSCEVTVSSYAPPTRHGRVHASCVFYLLEATKPAFWIMK